MTVMTLRRKLGDPPVIHTVRRAGYRLSRECPLTGAADASCSARSSLVVAQFAPAIAEQSLAL